MKPLSTKTHGTIDYVWAGLLPVLSRLLAWRPGVVKLLWVAGLGTLFYSLFTRYERGAVKVLPMKAHLTVDIIQGVVLASAPLWLHENKKKSAALVGLGALALFIALNTEDTVPAQASWYQRWQQKGLKTLLARD